MPDTLFVDPTILVQLLVLGVLLGGIYGFVSLGLTIIYGVMNVVNIAHGAFLVIGMYSVWFVSESARLSPFVAIPVAAALMFIVGIVIQRSVIAPLVDASQANKVLATIAISIILLGFIELQFGATPRELDLDLGSIEGGGVYILRGQLYALLIAGVTYAAVWMFLQYTHTGRAMRGTADNRLSAAYAGINTERIDYLTFGLGAGLAGLAGALIAVVQPFDPYLGNQYLTIAFLVVVLGGRSIPGTIIGGFLIGLLHVFGSFYLPGSYYQILILVVFILLLLFRPTGLFGGDVVE